MTIKKTVAVLSVATSAALAFVGCGDFGTNLPFSGCTPVTGNLIIANANTVRGCDIDTLAFVSEITPPSGVTLPSFGGFDATWSPILEGAACSSRTTIRTSTCTTRVSIH